MVAQCVTMTNPQLEISHDHAKLDKEQGFLNMMHTAPLTAIYIRYIVLGSCAFYSIPVILIIAPVIDPILLSQVYYQVGESPNLRF